MRLNRNIMLQGKSWNDSTLELAFDELNSLLKKHFGVPSWNHKISAIEVKFELKTTVKGFSVSAGQNKLTFRAPTAVEILYAVYEFAEEFLGFCFFEPGVDRVDKRSASIELEDGTLIANRQPVITNRGFIQEFPFHSYQAKV